MWLNLLFKCFKEILILTPNYIEENLRFIQQILWSYSVISVTQTSVIQGHTVI
jgi:hypothetical protein